MSKCDDILALARNDRTSLRFSQLLALAACHGLVERRRKGSHVILSRAGLPRPIPVQEGQNGMAKAYQVKQILAVIDADENSTADENA
jgi:hypothetical protein